MDTQNDTDNDEQTVQSFQSMTMALHHRFRISDSDQQCVICGSKAIGMNFGARTCAPCKAFFRRNARRKEILTSPCQHRDFNLLQGKNMNDKTNLYLQIRRCSSCRLRRCFEIGMKEELVRTDEQNERHKKLVTTNRNRREMLKQQENQLAIPQRMIIDGELSTEIDWRHLSNIVSAYDVCCLKTYIEQRATRLSNGTSLIPCEKSTIEPNTVLPMNLAMSLSSFLRSLPAFQSLSHTNQSYICKNNIRPLMFVNFHELSQSCFSEPQQIASDKSAMKLLCGSELFDDFERTEKLAEKSLIADPIVTRLWLIVLFFSTRLFCYYDKNSSRIKMKKKLPFTDIQNAYVNLLWKYLLHRHEHMEAVRIYSNLIFVFLNMLRVGIEISIRLRTKTNFISTHETLDQLVTLDINDV